MPELPEVETFRRQAMRAIGGQRLTHVAATGDSIVFENIPSPKIIAALVKRRVTGSGRKGKHLWLDLDGDGPSVLFHFGMSGSFSVYRDVEDRPSYWKIELQVEDGTRLALRMPRRLGRIRLRNAPALEPPISKLGFDPHAEMLAPAAFRKAIQARKRPIKALLLDQSFAAGIGNWIADEVLFQAKIHPAVRADALAAADIDRLRLRIISVLNKAVDVEADDALFPKSWLFHHRWGKKADAKTAQGHALAYTEVGGRTTAYVPAVQGKGPSSSSP